MVAYNGCVIDYFFVLQSFKMVNLKVPGKSLDGAFQIARNFVLII